MRLLLEDFLYLNYEFNFNSMAYALAFFTHRVDLLGGVGDFVY